MNEVKTLKIRKRLEETFLYRIPIEDSHILGEGKLLHNDLYGKREYAVWQASWYDPIKWLWNVLVASRAERDLSTFLRENLDETKTILELGCGTAMNLEKIFSLNLKFKSYIGLDFSPDMLRIARRKFQGYPNVEFAERDITKLNDIYDKFDILICTWVNPLSPSAFVNEVQGMLKENGKFFLLFFSEPKWYLRFWILSLIRPALRFFSPLTEVEVGKFKNVRRIHRYSGNLVTVVEINQAADYY